MLKKGFAKVHRVISGLARRAAWRAREFVLAPAQTVARPRIARNNSKKSVRHLEIGPGPRRIPGFETLNVVGGSNVDYLGDASERLNFPDNTFDTIYASHIVEHIPWYQVEKTLCEWVTKLKQGGVLEIWVPDGLKIAKAFVAAEGQGSAEFKKDGWWRFNPEQDPCLWAAGRFFSYGDGTGREDHQNWHRSLYSERFLRKLMTGAGLVDVQRMGHDEVRGHDHGWINLGLKGRKP